MRGLLLCRKGHPVVKAEHISFSYSRKPLLEDLSFSAEAGECTVLAGPNGSGKSTALALTAGILKPDSGSITLTGRLGFVPQGTALFEDMTVRDNLAFFASLAKTSVPKELPFDILRYKKYKVSALSGGTKKRVSIACALLGDPEVLLFDEPCAGLDILYRDELAALIGGRKAAGCAILYVGHEPSEFAPFYDRLVCLGNGSAVTRTREELSGSASDPLEQALHLETAFRSLCGGLRTP